MGVTYDPVSRARLLIIPHMCLLRQNRTLGDPPSFYFRVCFSGRYSSRVRKKKKKISSPTCSSRSAPTATRSRHHLVIATPPRNARDRGGAGFQPHPSVVSPRVVPPREAGLGGGMIVYACALDSAW